MRMAEVWLDDYKQFYYEKLGYALVCYIFKLQFVFDHTILLVYKVLMTSLYTYVRVNSSR